MKRVLMIMTVLAVGFTSCKKEETGSTEKTTIEKIATTWSGDEITLEIVAPPPIPTQNVTEDISYLNINFKNDGTYTADSLGISMDSGNWSAPDDNTFILDGETFDIKVLTESQFHVGLDSIIDLGGGSTASFSQMIKLKK